jgi:hypothetical protein
LAAICGAELGARYIGFGEPPSVDDRIEYDLIPGRSYTKVRERHSGNRYSMRSEAISDKAEGLAHYWAVAQ